MKHLIIILSVLLTFAVSGQSANEHFQNGLIKHREKDYKGAIKDYDKSIKIDQKFADAYYNRGTCELALQDFKPAIADFSKTIELSPKFTKAYYSRATVYVSMQKYAIALQDLDIVIELDPNTPNAYSLRGQIRAQTGNSTGGCEDFHKAKENGDQKAEKYILQFCTNELAIKESLKLDWPDEENWKIANSEENEKTSLIELIHANETIEKWTEFGYMMSIKGVKNLSMDKAMNLMFDQAKSESSKAKLTFIEKDENAEYPWIIFIIESPNFKNDKTPESQLWYVVQGKNTLYTNFRAVKQAQVPSNLKEKWIIFFKTGKIVN